MGMFCDNFFYFDSLFKIPVLLYHILDLVFMFLFSFFDE